MPTWIQLGQCTVEFAMLPPEINSGRLYAGPGSAPMLAAAAAWKVLAIELHAAASTYQSVVSTVASGTWLGPSSARMAAAASSYTTWLSITAAQVEQTAGQATAAAVAYETAFAATVPPEAIAANRSLLALLIATNLLGQNTPAIAHTEALYGQMWAQDVGAMSGYAGSAASATRVEPFSPPQQNTMSNGLAGQAGAVSQAGEVPGGTARGTLSRAFSAAPEALSNLASGSAAGTSLSPLDLLDLGADLIAFGIDAPMSPFGVISLPVDLIGAQTGLHTDTIVSGWGALGEVPAAGGAPIAPPANAVAPMISAGVGEADVVGGLSVPPTWIAGTPAVRPIALALSAVTEGGDTQALSAIYGNALGDMTLANAAGRAAGNTLGVRAREAGKGAVGRMRWPAADIGALATSSSQTPTADAADDATTPTEPRTVVTGIAAEIRAFAKLRDDGMISEEEYMEQRNHLLGRRPGRDVPGTLPR